MEGKFSLKEFIAGGGKESWFKSWGYGWRLIITILAIIFIVLTIYRAFFMKTQTQKQTANIIALPMSHITYAPQQEQKQEIKKRSWWLPILFIEGYGFSENDGRAGIGIKSGARLEW